MKELSANMDSDSEICLIGIFAVGFMKDYGRGNQFGKVVHDKAGKDLLVYVLHLFCMEMEQSNGVFSFPEGSLNNLEWGHSQSQGPFSYPQITKRPHTFACLSSLFLKILQKTGPHISVASSFS